MAAHNTASVRRSGEALPQLPAAGAAGPLLLARRAFAEMSADYADVLVPVEVSDREEAHVELVVITDLLEVLALPQTSRASRRAVWSRMIARAADGNEWTLALIALAYPVLRTTANRLAGEFPFADEHDLESHLIVAFLTRAFAEDPAQLAAEKRDVPGYLASRAHTAVRRAMAPWREEEAWTFSLDELHDEDGFDPADLPHGRGRGVLERAVMVGVLSEAEAELIAATRIDGVSVKQAAGGRSRASGFRDRAGAERRLAAWMLGKAPEVQVVRPAD